MTLMVKIAEGYTDAVKSFINLNKEQLGYLYPLSQERINRLFPPSSSCVLLNENEIVGVFRYGGGIEKTAPTGFLRFVVKDSKYIQYIVDYVVRTAMAQEKHFLRILQFDYNKKIVNALINLGFKVGAEVPEMASYNGKLYSQLFLYYDLKPKYKFRVERSYKDEELYPIRHVERAKNPQLKVRGIKQEDLGMFETIFNQPNVFRTMGSGVFEGSVYVNKEQIFQLVLKKEYYTLACIDERTSQPVGFISLGPMQQDVSKSVGSIGMFVDERYQGIGVGSLLMKNTVLLAKRLHLRLLFLSVLNTNPAGIKLYEKFGFVEHGKVPGWFQNGYVDEIMMTKKIG